MGRKQFKTGTRAVLDEENQLNLLIKEILLQEYNSILSSLKGLRSCDIHFVKHEIASSFGSTSNGNGKRDAKNE